MAELKRRATEQQVYAARIAFHGAMLKMDDESFGNMLALVTSRSFREKCELWDDGKLANYWMVYYAQDATLTILKHFVPEDRRSEDEQALVDAEEKRRRRLHESVEAHKAARAARAERVANRV